MNQYQGRGINMLTIKPRLCEILKGRGLTQGQLSKMTGIPQAGISRFDKTNNI
jgi:hypothetical protein